LSKYWKSGKKPYFFIGKAAKNLIFLLEKRQKTLILHWKSGKKR